MGMGYREVLEQLGLNGEVPEGIWSTVIARRYPDSEVLSRVYWEEDLTNVTLKPETGRPTIGIFFGDSLSETEQYRVTFHFNDEFKLASVTLTNEL